VRWPCHVGFVGGVCALGSLVIHPVFAQVTIDDLTTPSAPGFVVLGVEPASVSRPASPRAVALSLLSAIRDGDNIVPKNYALEITPFWLTSHPTLTYQAYDDAGIADTLIRSLSVSVVSASVPADSNGPDAIGLGFGLRGVLLKGAHNSEIPRLLVRLKELQIKILEATSETDEERLEAELQQVALDVQAQNRQRVGWTLEMATALAAKYPESDYERGRVTRFGFWVTPAYELERPRLSFVGVARYLRDSETDATEANLVDLGFRIQAEWEQLGLATEAVRRLGNGANRTDDATRLMGLVDYRISDDLYLTASVGKDYEDRITGRSNLVSFMGLNFGLSKKPTVRIE